MKQPPGTRSRPLTPRGGGIGERGSPQPALRPGTGVAQYLQLASLLRHRIAQGELAPGARLPTVAEMAAEHGIARVTVRQAYAVLVQESLITSRRGQGTRVSERPAAMNASLRAAINDPGTRELQIRILDEAAGVPLPDTLLRAGCQAAASYAFVRKLHLHDAEPFCLAEIHVASDIQARFPPGSQAQQKIAWLLSIHADARQLRMQQTLSVAPADVPLARRLGCAFGTPAARMTRWVFDRRGRIVYAGLFWYRGDRFLFDVELPFDLWLQHPAMAIPEARPPASSRLAAKGRPMAARRRAA